MLEDRIAADFKEAMKARDVLRTQTVSFLRSEMKYYAIDKKKDAIDDSDVLVVIKKLIKQRQDSIQQFEKGNRMDLVNKEKTELAILKAYLPAEMPQQDIIKIVDEVALGMGIISVKDMGRVMKEVMAKTQGRADNKMVSDIVRKKLENKV
ncbi:MAG: glutamyl-tRNA amidotransferase [Candidatus Omnitrophica bacterium CG_4_10_14_0_2_um_filter_44_9]|nr:MAG: glutamyl-tRNA amidotransferase [Candidatus Omnitrophica bacterium CG_4_10_14_0_8_um_filter_44_12]PIZ84289.1 MAG: glutamyl-tRNA amidotransferase [Candidatus Omnitrophica bacterium CG_4_10_14_0_2_um_filter_44_9]